MTESITASLATKLDDNPKVVWNWRDWYKMHSVQANAVGAVFNIICASAVQSFLVAPLIVLWSIRTVLAIGAILFLMGAFGRILVQKGITQANVPTDLPP